MVRWMVAKLANQQVADLDMHLVDRLARVKVVERADLQAGNLDAVKVALDYYFVVLKEWM